MNKIWNYFPEFCRLSMILCLHWKVQKVLHRWLPEEQSPRQAFQCDRRTEEIRRFSTNTMTQLFLPQKKNVKFTLSINFYPSRNKQWKTNLTKHSSKSKMCVYRVKLLLFFFQLRDNHLTPMIISHSTWSPLAQSMEHLNKSQRNLDVFLILPFLYFIIFFI